VLGRIEIVVLYSKVMRINKIWRIVLAAVLAGVFVWKGSLERAHAADWPIFRGDRALTGVAAGELTDRPTLLWSFKTDGPVKSSPVVADGRVFIGSDDGRIYAIDLKTGEKVWAFHVPVNNEDEPSAIEASPLVVRGMVYIGALDGFLYALDARTGELRWRYETEGEINGAANWTENPAGEGYRVLVGSWDSRLHCVDAATGKSVWVYETENYVNGTPAIADGKAVFGGCDGFLHVLSLRDGKQVASVEVGSYVIGSATFDGRYAYLGHRSNAFVCIDTVGKRMRWQFRQRQFPYAGSGAVVDHRVVFGGRDKRLHCVDRETGKAIWELRTHGQIDSSPVVCDGKVVVGSGDGRLYLAALVDGKQLWTYEIGQPITGSPAVSDGVIVIGSHDGFVYAFGRGKAQP